MEFDELLRTAIVRKADDPFIKGLTNQSSYETSAEGAKAGGRGGQSYISVTNHGSVGQNKLFCNEIFKLLNQFKTQKNSSKGQVGSQGCYMQRWALQKQFSGWSIHGCIYFSKYYH